MTVIAEAVPVSEFHRALYNSILYSNKGGALQGGVLFSFHSGWIEVYSGNDYVAVRDFVEATASVEYESGPGDLVLPLDEVKVLEKDLRDSTGEVPLSYVHQHPEASSSREVPDELWEMWKETRDLFDDVPITDGLIIPPKFAVNPDWFRKLSLVKPGDYPLDFAWNHSGRYLLHVRAGPDTRIIISPLDREHAAEHYGERTKEVFWD